MNPTHSCLVMHLLHAPGWPPAGLLRREHPCSSPESVGFAVESSSWESLLFMWSQYLSSSQPSILPLVLHVWSNAQSPSPYTKNTSRKPVFMPFWATLGVVWSRLSQICWFQVWSGSKSRAYHSRLNPIGSYIPKNTTKFNSKPSNRILRLFISLSSLRT